jgi:hypothetical protein
MANVIETWRLLTLERIRVLLGQEIIIKALANEYARAVFNSPIKDLETSEVVVSDLIEYAQLEMLDDIQCIARAQFNPEGKFTPSIFEELAHQYMTEKNISVWSMELRPDIVKWLDAKKGLPFYDIYNADYATHILMVIRELIDIANEGAPRPEIS